MLVCLESGATFPGTGPDERYQLTLKLFEIVHHHHPLQRLIAQGARWYSGSQATLASLAI